MISEANRFMNSQRSVPSVLDLRVPAGANSHHLAPSVVSSELRLARLRTAGDLQSVNASTSRGALCLDAEETARSPLLSRMISLLCLEQPSSPFEQGDESAIVPLYARASWWSRSRAMDPAGPRDSSTVGHSLGEEQGVGVENFTLSGTSRITACNSFQVHALFAWSAWVDP